MSQTDQPRDVRPSWPTGEAVKAFLRRHPAFLADDPDLLASLLAGGSPSEGKVVDLQSFVIQRLQRELEGLRAQNTDLAGAREGLRVAAGRVHEAVLALLGARSFEQFVALATGEVTGLLAVDVLTFCLESPDTPPPPPAFPGVHVLREGAIDALIGPENDLRIATESRADPAIFGDQAPLLRSEAMVRIHLGENGPAGLLGLGSRFPEAFAGEEAEDLLRFLARSVEQCIFRWLELHASA